MDKLKTMRTFVEVTQQRSFGAAALKLGVSTSLVSKHISELEANLGVRLLSRTTRHIEITEIGQRYYESCVDILRDVDSAEDSIHDMQRSAGGTITVRASHSLVALQVGRLISDFAAKYPSVQVHLIVDEDPAHAMLEAQRGLDVAFHVGHLARDGLAARRLASVQWHVYGADAYLKRHGAPQTPADLCKHNCLVHATASPGGVWEFQARSSDAMLAQSVAVAVNGTIHSNSFLALRQAAVDGIGLALLPSFCVAPVSPPPPLVRVLHEHPMAPRELQLLMSPDRRRPKRIRFFVDFAVRWFETEQAMGRL